VRFRLLILMVFLALAVFSGFADSRKKERANLPAVSTHVDDGSVRIEGERRFHANCGRCHAAPQKFPPRVMATVVRHMRVRATITDEDMRYILRYLTQ